MSDYPEKLELEDKKKWVEALRSGKYKQGKNRLKNDDVTFCCLGVACEIGIACPRFSGQDDYVSNGLCSETFLVDFVQKQLTEMNDGRAITVTGQRIESKSFNEIADWIEINL